ncbi:MAG TPA: PAS domain S-box protein [Thermoanaerobaculia bacterium]|nr:PAS domain S-box protein [Thermoanaerobaculia bacterium]
MSAPVVARGVDLLIAAIAHPVIRLTAAGRIVDANEPARRQFSWIADDAPFVRVAPHDLGVCVTAALASTEDEVALDTCGARLLRASARERLLLFDIPEVAAYHELDIGLLVWEYDVDLPTDADSFRLLAANRQSELIGPRRALRSFIGRTRGEAYPISDLSPLYLQVARTQEPAEMEIRDVLGKPFRIRLFPLPGRRIGAMFEDVTALRQSEHGFRTMFDRSRDAILIFDPDSQTVVAANPAAKQLFASGKIVGKALRVLFDIDAEFARRVRDAGYLREQVKGGRDGGQRQLDIHAMPIEYGQQQAVMAIVTDITATAETLRTLVDAQEQYSALIENLPVIIWTVKAGGSVFISPRSERVTGFTPEQIQNPSFAREWAARVHPEDLPRVAEAYARLFRDGTPFEAEYRFQRPDGVWRWIADHAVQTYERDGEILASGVSADVTERRRAGSLPFALANFGRRALRMNDDATLLDDACRTIAEVLEVPAAHILRFDAGANEFRFAAGMNSKHPPEVPVPNEPGRLAAQALISESPIVYANLEKETRFVTAELLNVGIRAGVIAPIAGRAKPYGVVHAYTIEPRAFSDSEAAFVESMANILAEAIDRNRAERELERRTAQLTDAQAIAHIGSLRIDEETMRVEGSDELYRLFGIEPQSRELTFEWLIEHVAAESRGRLMTSFQRLDSEGTLDEEHVIHADDGVRRIAHYRATRRIDRLTGRRMVIGTVQDVTATREAETTLREHERRLQVILSRLPVILFSTDMDLRLTSVTGEGFAPIATNMLRDLELADLVGLGPEEGGPQVALDGRETTYDTKLRGRDLRVHLEPLTDDDTNAMIGVAGLAFDITEEKRVEEANQVLLQRLAEASAHWRWTFDAIRAPLLIVDHENRVLRLNAAALRFSQFSDYRQAIDRPVTELGQSLMWMAIDALAKSSRDVNEPVAVQFVEDDRVWDLLASSSEEQTVVFVSDVTEVVRMERNLRRAEKMSEMGALVAGVAHEVRNPLFGLSATIDAFEARFGAAEFHDYVVALREQIDRMSQLMHELLEFGRPVAAVLEPHDVVAVLRRARDLMDAFARQRGVVLRCVAASMVPQVMMDRQRLLQVFENLLKNAVEHSPHGGEVTISVRPSEDGASVIVEVADRGPGFAQADLERIFEPFFTKRRGGTGLGLSLASRIVEEHHGTTRASNRPGGGASMVVKLPVAERS